MGWCKRYLVFNQLTRASLERIEACDGKVGRIMLFRSQNFPSEIILETEYVQPVVSPASFGKNHCLAFARLRLYLEVLDYHRFHWVSQSKAKDFRIEVQLCLEHPLDILGLAKAVLLAFESKISHR